jgi:hypothetical protein
VLDKVALGARFLWVLWFPPPILLLHIHHLSFGAGTIGQLVADIPSGLSLTQPQGKNYPQATLLFIAGGSVAGLSSQKVN